MPAERGPLPRRCLPPGDPEPGLQGPGPQLLQNLWDQVEAPYGETGSPAWGSAYPHPGPLRERGLGAGLDSGRRTRVSCRSCFQTPSSSWMEPRARTSAREPWVGRSGSWVFFPQEFPLPVPSGSAPTPPSCKLRQALAVRAGAGLPRFLGLLCKLRGMPPRGPLVLPSMGKH